MPMNCIVYFTLSNVWICMWSIKIWMESIARNMWRAFESLEFSFLFNIHELSLIFLLYFLAPVQSYRLKINIHSYEHAYTAVVCLCMLSIRTAPFVFEFMACAVFEFFIFFLHIPLWTLHVHSHGVVTLRHPGVVLTSASH